jgi:membrane-associated phospholipid phosphatase
MFQAVFAGWLVPVAFPILAYAVGAAFGLRRARWAAFSVAQAVVVGLLVSSFYKALTGRPSPNHPLARVVEASREFRFGLLRGGVFFGWPSSHTAVAFSMASALWTLYPDSKVMRCAALLYAFYVGVGVSMTIHWFSDFVAGAILGIAIGITVGKSFRDIAVSSGFPNEKCNM